MLTPDDISTIGQLPQANRQKLPLTPGDDVEGASWKNLINLRLRVRGNNVFWVARGGTTLVNNFFGNVLTVKAVNTRVGSVTKEYLVVHTGAGKVYLWDIVANTSNEIASTGFSTTEQIQIFNVGRFIYLFDYDGGYSRYYDLKEGTLHPYMDYQRAYIHTQSWLSEELDSDNANFLDFKNGGSIIVFPNIDFSQGEEVFDAGPYSDGFKSSFNPKNYNSNSFFYTYNDGMYLEDSDGKAYKKSQFITFRQGTDNFGFTVRGTGTAFTIHEYYIPLNETGTPAFESYKARILTITGNIVSWKDPVGVERSTTFGGVVSGNEEDSNIIFPYNADLEELIGLPCRRRLNSDGSGIEENPQYVRPAVYRQYVIFELLKDGSVTQLGLPFQLELNSTDILVNGYTGVTLTATTPDTAVSERYLASTRWQPSADAAFDPSSPNYPNSPLFIVGPFTTSETIIRDKTPDSRLIRPVTEFVPTIAGVMDIFGPGELAPNSIARFRNSLMQAGYTVSRPIPVPYSDPSAPGNGNMYTNITPTTQLPNDMALAFMFEYSDGLKSDVVETEEFLQQGSVVNTTDPGCGQVKGTASHSLTGGVDYDGDIIVQYDGYQIVVSLNTASHGSAADAAEAIRAAIQADADIQISAAINTTPTLDYTEKRFGIEFNGEQIEYINVAPWDIGGASFVQSIATTNAVTDGLAFSADGTILLVTKDANDRIEEYALSTAWDISTAVSSGNFLDVTSEDTSPRGIAFGDSGTKLFVLGDANDSIFVYPLSTAYDITTAGAATSFSVSSETADCRDLVFSTDGTILYISAPSTIFQYVLSTAWDISTASFTAGHSFDTSNESVSIGGVSLKNDGLKLFLDDNDTLYEYNFGTAWDITTLSYSGTSFDVSTQLTDAAAIFINAGVDLYVVDAVDGDVYQYSLPDSIGVTFDTNPVAIAGAEEPTVTKTKGYIAVEFNGLNSGETDNLSVTIGGNTTAAFEVSGDDSPSTIRSKVRDAIDGDPTISAIWSTSGETFTIDGEDYPGVIIEGPSDFNDTAFNVNKPAVKFLYGAPGSPWKDTGNATNGGAPACESAEAYYDVSANNLSGTTEDHTLTLDGDSTDPITINDTDTPEGVVDKYIDAIQADASIDRLWRATKEDLGGGTWRLIVEYRSAGDTHNGLVVSITGDSAVTVAVTSPTEGGLSSGEVPDGPADEVSANLLQIHSLNALVRKVYVLGRTNDGTKRFHLIEEIQITDPGTHGRVIELPATEEALNDIELNTFETPGATEILETVELQNYVNIGTPAQQFNISTQEEIVDESRILKAIPLEFDVDKSTMRYRVMVFTSQNIQIGYLVDATVQGSRIFNGDFETIFEGLQTSSRFGIERRNGLVVWSTNDSLYAWSGKSGPQRLMDRRRYSVSESNEHQDVVYNAEHNELWVVYRNNEIIVIDLDTQSIRRMSYPAANGVCRAAAWYNGKMYLAADTGVFWTDQEDIYLDVAEAINVTAETDYFGDELSQIRLLDLTVGGQAFQLSVDIDYQDERFIDVGTGWGDAFEADQNIPAKTLNMAGKVFSLYRYAIMPRLRLTAQAVSGGFLSHVILKYTPTANEGQARE